MHAVTQRQPPHCIIVIRRQQQPTTGWTVVDAECWEGADYVFIHSRINHVTRISCQEVAIVDLAQCAYREEESPHGKVCAGVQCPGPILLASPLQPASPLCNHEAP